MARAVDLYRWRDAIMSEHGPRGAGVRLVLIAISLPMRADGLGSWQSQKTIALRTSVGLRTLKRYLQDAERDGWIGRVRVPVPGRTWRRTEYSACVPDEVYRHIPRRPWESDPSFRQGANLAPSYTGKRKQRAASKVPVAFAQRASGDESRVPSLGPLTLERTPHTNSSLESPKETEPERIRRFEEARRRALEYVAQTQGHDEEA